MPLIPQDDDYRPTQWERSVDRLRNLCDGLVMDELQVLQLFAAARLRFVRGEPEQIIDTSNLRPLPRIEAERLNREGLRQYRLGHPDFKAWVAVASQADMAKHDNDFQRFLGATVDQTGKAPTRGAL